MLETIDGFEDAGLVFAEVGGEGEFVAGDLGQAADAGEGVAEAVSESADHLAQSGEAFALDAFVEHGSDGAGHVVDFEAELSDFVCAADRDLVVEAALGDLSGGGAEVADGSEHPALKQDEGEDAEEEGGDRG